MIMPKLGDTVWYFPERADVPDMGRPGKFLNDTEELYAGGKPMDAKVVNVLYGAIDIEIPNPKDPPPKGNIFFRARVPWCEKGAIHPSSRYATPVGGA